MGGASIFRVKEGDPNIGVIAETLTELGTRYCMAQNYLPAIKDGDKRAGRRRRAGALLPAVFRARIPWQVKRNRETAGGWRPWRTASVKRKRPGKLPAASAILTEITCDSACV